MLPDALGRFASRLRPYAWYLFIAGIAGPIFCVLVVSAADFVADELTTRSLFVLLWLTVNHWAALLLVLGFGKPARLPHVFRWILALLWLPFATAAFLVPLIMWFA